VGRTFNGGGFNFSSRELFTLSDTSIDGALDITVQTTSEVLEHGSTSRQDDVLVETTTNVNRARLNDRVDNLGQGGQKVAGEDFRVEENFGSKETLITNINGVLLLGDFVQLIEDLEV